MTRLTILLLSIAGLVQTGCSNVFDAEFATSSPSAEHVAFCQEIMYLDPSVRIDAEGFQHIDWMDDLVRVKFVAHTDDISKLFLNPPVDASIMKPNFKLDNHGQYRWWDPSSQSLTGAEYELPNVKFMEVGYFDNNDGTLTVYIQWFET